MNIDDLEKEMIKGCRRITDEELAEPDVTITFKSIDNLPGVIREDLRLYGNRFNKDGSISITLPAYKWREIEQIMKQLNS